MSHVIRATVFRLAATLLTLGIATPILAAVPTFSITPRPNGIIVDRSGARMQVTALTDTILRVRISGSGRLPEDASWAVSAAFRARSIAVHATPEGFVTGAVQVRWDRT